VAYALPDPYRSAIRSGFALNYTVSASYKGQAVAGAQNMAPVGGQITDTAEPGVRRVLTLDLAPTPGLFDLLAPIGTTLTVTANVTYTNRATVQIPMGVFDVDDETLTEGGGKLSLTAPDLWQRIVRAKFLGPAASTKGLLVVSQIQQLIQGAGLTATVTSTSKATTPTLTFDQARDTAILDLAKQAGLWVYFDRNGNGVIADQPTTKPTADWLIDASDSGVLVSLDRSRSRTVTYNVIVVESSAAAGSAFATQYVFDNDPNSQTYVAGGTWGPTPPTVSPSSSFGLVPYYFDTPLTMSAAGAIQAGAAVLYKTTGLASQVSVTAVHNPAIDAFDAIDVLAPRQRYDIPRAVERHVVDTVTHPLDVTRPQQIDGRSTRTDSYQ